MSLESLSHIAPSASLYQRPVDFIDSPQFHDGDACRLAGTMIWFAAIELIVRDGETVTRHHVPVAQWDDALDTLPEALKGRASTLFANLVSPRAPLQMGERVIRLDQPQVMAILNITPDSFSDGGKHDGDPDQAAQAGFAMAASGAAIIDIGGESTRPGAPLIWAGDEIKRIEPVIRRLAGSGTAVSVDTRKAEVMRAALDAGAGMINDISALLYDDGSLALAAQASVPVVLMFAPGQGSNPHKGRGFAHALTEIYDWLEERVAVVSAAGVERDRIWIDPGLGFGYGEAKSLADDLALINNLAMFHAIGCPILFGASRKRLVGALSREAPVDQRLGGSLYLAMKAVEQGAQMVRVHDVPETVQAIHVWRGLRDAALTARN
ncbi:MAG: dihydropteroate synthase [Blastomonas sp.]